MRRELEAIPTIDLPSRPTSVDDLTIDDVRNELEEYYEIMEDFQNADASNNLMHLSAFTARMSRIRSHFVRRVDDRSIQQLRTKEIDPFLTECDRQFKIWSRLITAVQFEWETSGGHR